MSSREIIFSASGASQLTVGDVFSTGLYTGNGGSLYINNSIPLTDTAKWSCITLSEGSVFAYCNSVYVDSSGNVYVCGRSDDGTRKYGLIAKYNSSGTLQWQRKIYDSGSYPAFQKVVVNSSGDVYVVGCVDDGTQRAGIIKYNSSGTLQWQRKVYNSSYTAFFYGLGLDSSGNVYACGQSYDGTTTYGILIKYNSSGTLQWQRKITDETPPTGQSNILVAIKIDASDNVYVCGTMASTISGSKNGRGFLAKYDTSGAIQWQRKFYSGISRATAVNVDSSGNIYVGAGRDYSPATAVLLKYNSSGTLQWQREFYQFSGKTSEVFDVFVSSSDKIYLSCYFNETFDTAGIVEYNSSGTIQSLKQKISSNNEYVYCYGIYADGSGNLYGCGEYTTDQYATRSYGFLVKLKSDGSTSSGTASVNLYNLTLTESAGSMTDAAGTATDSAGAETDAAGTATDAAGTATSTSAEQPAVTGRGGMTWIKDRTSALSNKIVDTIRGATKSVISNDNSSGATESYGLSSFNANGFSVLNDLDYNTDTDNYASWTFAQAIGFFDVVTYTGNGANRTISHGLGSVPGCILIKRTDTTGDWQVYHRSLANTEYLVLNSNAGKATGTDRWNSTTATSSVFSLGTNAGVNANNGTYVAYLFGHATGFIQCGGYTGSGSSQTIDCGFTNGTQFVMIKRTDTTGDWYIWDSARGIVAGNDPHLSPNLSSAEVTTNDTIDAASSGFVVNQNATTNIDVTNGTYIFIAIEA